MVLLTLLTLALRGSQPERFEEIDVQRINVVESDGSLKMVITNQERFPDGVFDGRTFERTEKYPGIVFYNSDGDESGGLTFRTLRLPDGVEANASLNFDQYKQDRTLQLFYGEYQEQRTAGLAIFDQPDIPLSQLIDRREALENMPDGSEKTEATEALMADSAQSRRVFIGKNLDRSATFVLSDPQGRPRLVLAVDPAGEPTLQFLDEAGETIQSLPAGR